MRRLGNILPCAGWEQCWNALFLESGSGRRRRARQFFFGSFPTSVAGVEGEAELHAWITVPHFPGVRAERGGEIMMVRITQFVQCGRTLSVFMVCRRCSGSTPVKDPVPRGVAMMNAQLGGQVTARLSQVVTSRDFGRVHVSLVDVIRTGAGILPQVQRGDSLVMKREMVQDEFEVGFGRVLSGSFALAAGKVCHFPNCAVVLPVQGEEKGVCRDCGFPILDWDLLWCTPF